MAHNNTSGASAGSSPRGRGKLGEGEGLPVDGRLIPARAGKTTSPGGPRGGGAAHPRAGGENRLHLVGRVQDAGSSPRGRGKRQPRAPQRTVEGLIPARAGKTRSPGSAALAVTAHPRAGGENGCCCPCLWRRLGSSPRGRGKRGRAAGWWVSSGLIPARAGKTRARRRRAGRSRAHPRAGGENALDGIKYALASGSSPRGRGKRTRGWCRRRARRLIPARAGKTSPCRASRGRSPAHPRAGGENFFDVVGDLADLGSSPRGRGKQVDLRPQVEEAGLIPARAGKTTGRRGCAAHAWAHPRAGGENVPSMTSASASSGSSPRGRGKPTRATWQDAHPGLIPARAGKTTGSRAASRTPAAHPRAGGENGKLDDTKHMLTGSSPRGRGKPIAALSPSCTSGLIPARAGKTSESCHWHPESRAHPRAGGENPRPRDRLGSRPGSSPRGRGKRRAKPAGQLLQRLIPARAGKTTSCTWCGIRAPAHPRAGGENFLAF